MSFKIDESQKKLFVYDNITIDSTFVDSHIKSGDMSEWNIYVESSSVIKLDIDVDVYDVYVSKSKSIVVCFGRSVAVANVIIIDSNGITLLIGSSSKEIEVIRLSKSTDIYIQSSRFIKNVTIRDSIVTYIESPYINYITYIGQNHISTLNTFIFNIAKLSQYKLTVVKSPQYMLNPFEPPIELFDINDTIMRYMITYIIGT